MSRARELQLQLARWIAHEVPQAGDITIENLRRAGGGSSTENWLFEAGWSAGDMRVERALVLRCAPRSEVVVNTREDEFHLLRAIDGHGLLSPGAYWLDAQGAWMGRPAMVLEQCHGKADRGLLTARNTLGLDAGTQSILARELADALAAIHRLDAKVVDALPRSHAASADPARRELDLQEASLRRGANLASPEMRLAAAWLRANLPGAPAREVLVHGDFRPANVLVAQGKITAVLDWELAHRGDPAEDIGWYLAPVYRHEHFMAGAWTPADFVRRYEARSGLIVDRQAVRFWSVFAMYKLVAIALSTMEAFVTGDHARLAPFPHRLMEALMRGITNTAHDPAGA